MLGCDQKQCSEIMQTLDSKQTLFFIERSMDKDIVAYQTQREGNVLVPPFVDIFWTEINKLRRKEVVGSTAQALFFGLKVLKEGPGHYKMLVNAIPNRIIHIKLKKSGKCVAKTIVNNKECRLLKIYVQLRKGSLKIPEVESLWVYGIHKHDLISEKLLIDDEMRKKFDISNFLPSLGNFSF